MCDLILVSHAFRADFFLGEIFFLLLHTKLSHTHTTQPGMHARARAQMARARAKTGASTIGGLFILLVLDSVARFLSLTAPLVLSAWVVVVVFRLLSRLLCARVGQIVYRLLEEKDFYCSRNVCRPRNTGAFALISRPHTHTCTHTHAHTFTFPPSRPSHVTPVGAHTHAPSP